MRIAVIAAAICLSIVGLSSAQEVQASIRRDTNIPAEGLGPALQALAKTYQIQLLYRTEVVGDLRTAGAVGALTAPEALTKVLSGTGLSFKYLDEKTVTIIPARSAVQAAGGATIVQQSPAGQKEGKTESSSGFLLSQAASGQAPSNPPVGPQSPPAPQAPAGTLQEVVVTAQKRTERAQDVPASIQVLSGDQLLSQGVVELSDYAKQVPGLTLIGASGPGRGLIVLRGISSGAAAAPLVGVYLDDVPFTPSSPNSLANTEGFAFDPDLADIERIEVLEGPQSTLYGASSMGGVVKFVTKQPDLEDFGGSVRLDGSDVDGGGAGYGVRGSVNIPIIPGTAALRASTFYRDDAGFVDNDANNTSNINHDSVKGARLSLLFKFSEDLETTLSGLVQNVDQRGPNLVYLNPKTLQPSNGGLSYSSPLDLSTSISTQAISDSTTFNMHFATLTNIASFARLSALAGEDFTSYDAYIGAPAGVFLVAPVDLESRRFSDELRLTSSPGRVEWLLGLFYTHENDPDDVPLHGADSSGAIQPPSSPFYDAYSYQNTSTFTEKAVFGDLTYHMTDQLDGTVGVRYSADDQSFNYASGGLLDGGTNVTGNGTSSESAETYLATLSYKLAQETSLYLRAASAYRPGGPNILNTAEIASGAPVTYGADKLWNYEAGIKGSLWDRRVTYTADVYHMDWRDMQLNVIVDGFDVVANAARAKSDGAEAAVQIAPVEGLTMTLNAAYSDAKLTSNIPEPINALSGTALPYAPKASGAFLVDYRWAAAVAGATPHAGITYAYHGSDNTAFTTSGTTTLPGYETLDLRAGMDWSRYSVVARIDNVTNKYALTDAEPTTALGAPLGGVVLRPRTYGVSISARF